MFVCVVVCMFVVCNIASTQIDLDKVPLPNPDRYETQTWEYTMMVSMLESYIRPATWLWAIANTLQLVQFYKLVLNSDFGTICCSPIYIMKEPVKKLDY